MNNSENTPAKYIDFANTEDKKVYDAIRVNIPINDRRNLEHFEQKPVDYQYLLSKMVDLMQSSDIINHWEFNIAFKALSESWGIELKDYKHSVIMYKNDPSKFDITATLDTVK